MLLRVRELSDGCVERVTDVVDLSDAIEVEVIDVDDCGKIEPSRRTVLQPDAALLIAR